MALTRISSQTASNTSSLSFTSGIDSTYDAYEFHFINMHPITDGVVFQFQCNASGQTGFNEVITSTHYIAYNNEAGTADYALMYYTSGHQKQGTNYQWLTVSVGNFNDESASGILTLHNPASTTFATNFESDVNTYNGQNYVYRSLVGGYVNTTSAITEIDFKFSSGNIDKGTIHLYGVS